MGVINNFFNLFKKKEIKNYTDDELMFLKSLGVTPDYSQKAINQITYYTCCKIISESIGKLNFDVFKQENGNKQKVQDIDLFYFLHVRPNQFTSPTMLMTTLMQNVLRTGNGYLYLDYKGYKLQGIYNLPSQSVTILADNKGILNPKKKVVYQYTDTDRKSHYIDSDNIIHIKTSDTIDGLVGKSVAETLASTLKTSQEADNYLYNLYKQGLSARAVLQYTGDLNKEAEERLINGITNFANGSKNTGKIIPLPLGMSLQTLDMKLADAQFLEMKEVNSLNLASAFQISPTYINIYKNSSYNNTEQETLRYLNTCLLFYIQQIEEQINYKCLTKNQVKQGYSVKLDVSELLRTDAKTQQEILCSYVANGIYSTNEARLVLDKPSVEEGDNLFMNGSNITLKQIVEGINYDDNKIQMKKEEDDEGGDKQ